jgi:hypothetical protein
MAVRFGVDRPDGGRVSAVDDWDEDDESYEPDDSDEQYEPDFDDDRDDDWREPDGDDYEIAKAYEEEAAHRETVHGGGECDCRPSLLDRLTWHASDMARRAGNARARLTIAMHGIYTLRIGRAEVTLRLNADRRCGACGGRGWAYSLDRSGQDDRPPGYNGVSLCGCGSAIGKLADTRRYLRSTWDEPPFLSAVHTTDEPH